MDTFFIGHGPVKVIIDETIPVRSFLQAWKSDTLPETPKAILMISGHWDTLDTPTVNGLATEPNDILYDFTGFPEFFYQLKYPAPGAPHVAQRVKDLLDTAGFGPVKEDKARGLDHGAWIPLKLMYPDANIPVCELSVQTGKSAGYHYKLGSALAPLRDEGVLIIGSGHVTHNFKARGPEDKPIPKWASDFDAWFKDALLNGRYDDVNTCEKVEGYKMNHIKPDHLFPLHIALGAAGKGAKATLMHHSWTDNVISYASYRFTAGQ
ncbi:hypothetical protein LUZ63_008959 [Rhynchospora breviuscula]|uniref:Extradiol ring-cleavage dioxygenase class III enzyme subunit B domain-containing protein n=1 Tax=Rhynchospora breviuscula TaxID=2022672 RepID=A0A9Q0HN20_9POAL|nr:hypothetical protein LUZ63_008959 [Rhynchospora breviuscula]